MLCFASNLSKRKGVERQKTNAYILVDIKNDIVDIIDKSFCLVIDINMADSQPMRLLEIVKYCYCEEWIMKHKKGFYEKYVKVPQDVILSAIFLIVLSPIIIILAIFIFIKLGSPIIFKQERAGKDGKPFYMYKFRSMSDERNENGDLLPDEERLGQFGKILRSTSLDELPSLWNVVIADCSLCGPRALYMRYIPRYSKRQARRLEVRPGITGLAQVNGRNTISWEDKFKYDVQYVDNISFIGDWKIMFCTVGKVLKREGISSATSVTMEEFMGTESEYFNNE